MANYRITKGNVGPWPEGTVITDKDLADNPGLGGVERLRNQLGVIEDTTDEPSRGAGEPVPPELTTGNPVGVNEVRKLSDGSEARAEAGPNAPSHRRGGKS